MVALRPKGSFVENKVIQSSSKRKVKLRRKKRINLSLFLAVVAVSSFLIVLNVNNTNLSAHAESLNATATHIVINEVYYDPVNGKDSGKGAEWVEIYNPTSNSIDISGWRISDDPVPNGANEGYWGFPSGTIIKSGGYIVVTGDTAEFQKDFPNVIPNFDTNSSNSIPNVNKGGSFGLADSGDDVHLFDSNGNEIDVMWYGNGGDKGSNNAAPDVPEGHSLARYYNAEDTDNPVNDFYDEPEPTPKNQNSQAIPELTFVLIPLIFLMAAIYRKWKT
jgi:hypothetical protein